MYSLTVTEALKAVRKNLDELSPNDSVMYIDENNDNASIDDIIKRYLPDAINSVVKAAPVTLLEGEVKSFETGEVELANMELGILDIVLPSSDLLRLVALKMFDSEIVVTDAIPEASPEGRKQLNKYIRGQYDRPRLVRLQGDKAGTVRLRYYCLNPDDPNYPIFENDPREAIEYLIRYKEQIYNEASPATSYNVPDRLRQNILDCVTAMVLEAYSDQRSQTFYQKANNF